MLNPALQMIKEDNRLPDYFLITIIYHDKSEDEFKAVSHMIKNDLIEIFTSDSLFQVIPLNAVRRLSFDKNFTKIQDLHVEKMKKEQK